ncbi:hypothetical protein Ancab_036050 [Ancistrocladus abbreviatus]
MTNAGDKCLAGKTLTADALVLKGQPEMEQAIVGTKPLKRKRKRSKKNKADSVTNCNPGYFALCETPNMRQGSSLKGAVDSCIQVDGEVPSCGTGGSLSLEKKLGDIKSFNLDRKQGDKRVLDHLDVVEHSNHASEIAKLDPVGRSSEICVVLHSINKVERKGKRKRKRSNKNKADVVTNCNPGDFALRETANMRQGLSLKDAVDSCIQMDEEVPSCGTGGSLSLEKKLGDLKSFNLDGKQGDKRVLDHLDVMEHSNHASEIAKLDPVGRSSEICAGLHSINKEEGKGKRKRKRSKKNKADSATNCNPGDIALRETTYMEQGSCLKNAVNSCIQVEEEVPPCGTGVTKRIVGHLDVMEHSDHASEIAKLDPVGRSSEICVGLHSVNKVERKRKRKRKRSKKTKADSVTVTNCNPGYFALRETPNMRRGSSLKDAVDSCIQVDGEVPSCGTEGSLSLEKKLGDIKSSNLDRKQGDKRVFGHLDVMEHSNHASEIAKLDPVGRSSEICVVLHSINKVERKGKRKRKRSKKNKADGSTNCKTTNMQQGSSLKDAVDSCMQMDEEVPFCGTGVSLSLEKKLGDIKSLNLDRKQGDKRILVYLDAMDHSNDASEIAKLDPVGRSSEICAGLPSINKKDIAEVSVHSRRKRNRIHHRRGKGSNSSLCSLPSTGEVMATCSSVPFLGTNFVGGASSSFVNAELKSGFSENINKVAGYGYSLNEVMVIDLPSKHLGWASGVATSKMQAFLPNPLVENRSSMSVTCHKKERTYDDSLFVNKSCINAELSLGSTHDGKLLASNKDDSLFVDKSCINVELPLGLRHGGTLVASVKDDHSKRISESSSVLQCLSNPATQCSRRKLLILDLNGLLADIVPYCSDRYTPNKTISSKAVFKRPFCDDFLQFCFERFDVGIWSSRTRKNVAALVDFLLGATKQKLLFCWGGRSASPNCRELALLHSPVFWVGGGLHRISPAKLQNWGWGGECIRTRWTYLEAQDAAYNGHSTCEVRCERMEIHILHLHVMSGTLRWLTAACLFPLYLCAHDQSHCTKTGYSTMENKDKPLFLKELKKIWNKRGPDLRWVKGQYDESNTLLLDDTPYKALRNPPYTAIFPRPFVYKNVKDTSLGPGGDLRVYLERLAAAENVQVFVKENPFGQKPITRSNLSWNFYAKIIRAELSEPKGKQKRASAS